MVAVGGVELKLVYQIINLLILRALSHIEHGYIKENGGIGLTWLNWSSDKILLWC